MAATLFKIPKFIKQLYYIFKAKKIIFPEKHYEETIQLTQTTKYDITRQLKNEINQKIEKFKMMNKQNRKIIKRCN